MSNTLTHFTQTKKYQLCGPENQIIYGTIISIHDTSNKYGNILYNEKLTQLILSNSISHFEVQFGEFLISTHEFIDVLKQLFLAHYINNWGMLFETRDGLYICASKHDAQYIRHGLRNIDTLLGKYIMKLLLFCHPEALNFDIINNLGG